MSGMTKHTYARLLARDGGRCLHCGATEGLVPQHRLNRGMGGSRLLETAANVVTLCAGYNGLIESDARAAEQAREYGWKLRPGTLPEAKAVYDMNTRRWYYLDNDWNRSDAFD